MRNVSVVLCCEFHIHILEFVRVCVCVHACVRVHVSELYCMHYIVMCARAHGTKSMEFPSNKISPVSLATTCAIQLP